ncbi:MAG TPA: sugar transferase [Gemmatimonadaceae bacterium]|nr:sugar transferase [Gemmatimonadaceae bacterium]
MIADLTANPGSPNAAERSPNRRRARHSTAFPRRNSGRVVRLPVYDVRVRRELAHRRFVMSLFRQALRIVSLHALDAAVMMLAFAIARAITGSPASLNLLAVVVSFMLLGLNVSGSYRPGPARRDAPRLVVGAMVGASLLVFAVTLLPSPLASRAFIGIFALTTLALLVVERVIVDAIVHQIYAHGYLLRRALLVARANETPALLSGLLRPHSQLRPEDDHMVVGYVTPDRNPDPAALGTLDDIDHVLEEKDVSELLIATDLRDETLADVAERCFEQGVRVLVIPPAPHTLRGWAELTRVGRWPAYQLHPARLELPALILKRASDLVLASVGLAAGAPLMACIAAAIKLETRGPVFFKQRRVGLGGREFMMWKFRSMYDEAESRQHEVAHLNPYPDERLFKLPRDPRITRVGRLLRRFSLDELPQLINIIAGDMSVVGPRPPLPSEVKRYEHSHYIRLSVVPGLTGPWQVNGRNLITDFEHVVRLEREYIESWSLRSDVEIIVRTIGVVLSGKGAY